MAINALSDMSKPQGLAKEQEYEAIVVENNDKDHHEDKRMLGRVQTRVKGIMDGIPDEHLPWAIIKAGSGADGSGGSSGSFSVPKKGTKVLVKFQNGKASHPMYSPYTVDESTMLEEAKHNYPDRTVHLHSNGCMQIVDTKTNEVFFRNPGDMKIYVQGDVELKVEGNLKEEIDGNRTTHVKGNSIEVVDGDKKIHVAGTTAIVSSGNMTLAAPRIDEKASGGAAPNISALGSWPGVRGKSPNSE
jgi:hypothetical protein